MKYIEPLARLIAQLSKLPSVGEKTAARYAYAILNSPEEEVNELVDAIRDVKQNVHFCKICGNYTENEICDVCATRKPSVICVVKEPKDIVALEKVKDFKGVYHVLGGDDFDNRITQWMIDEFKKALFSLSQLLLSVSEAPSYQRKGLHPLLS